MCDPRQTADLYLSLIDDDEAAEPRRPRALAAVLAGALMCAAPLTLAGMALADGPTDGYAIRAEAATDDGDDDDDDRDGRNAQATVDGNTDRNSAWTRTGNTVGAATTVPSSVDGNTGRNAAWSVTGNTRNGDTTRVPATKDGNTNRNSAWSLTGNTRGGGTTVAATRDGNTAQNPAWSITGNTRTGQTTGVTRDGDDGDTNDGDTGDS